MSYTVRQKSFTPAPEGIHLGICVDVIDLGLQPTQWGEQEKVRLVWELEAKMPDGRPYLASKRYTPSLSEKSNLYKDLKGWRGKPFTAEELKEFDLEKVIGTCCTLVITHDEKEGQVYANITAISKATKRIKQDADPSGNPYYVRAKDRPDWKAPRHANQVQQQADNTDPQNFPEGKPEDDIPF